MRTHLRLIYFVLIVLSAKVCVTKAKSLTKTNATENVANNEKSQVSNYFVHEPYGPNTYAFGFEIKDPRSGNIQFRDERRFLNGSMEGSYGYVRPDGLISVTHFIAGNQTGYLSQTKTYAPGDDAAQAQHWPTKKPHIFIERPPMESNNANVTYDAESHLNVPNAHVADEVANMLKEQHGIDLNQIDAVNNDLLPPVVQELISGKVPLIQQPNDSLGIQTVHNFIPNDFPIKPFVLPDTLSTTTTTTNVKPATLQVVEEKDKIKPKPAQAQEQLAKPASIRKPNKKYDAAKLNNAEKSPQTLDLRNEAAQDRIKQAEVVADSTGSDSSRLLPLPKPLDAGNDDASIAWYNKIIDDNRREFLQNLPTLN